EEASRLASGPTKGYAATKRLLAGSLDNPLETQLANEGETIAELTDTTDFARGHAAFGGDEPPEFVGE
ncbi:MAG: enoyl-CoA hydratase/isomerase family protein, partial [Natronomonas sp.]|nr:enoyl-CoA hydratase/isomerase family protein [Natronomonas sp.]